MNGFKDYLNSNLDEGRISGIAFERRLKSYANKVQSTDDLGRKMDLIAKMIQIGEGGLLLQIQKVK